MTEKKFSFREAIKFGWDTMKKNIKFFIPLLIVAFLIENLPGIISSFVSKDFPFIGSLLYMASWFLGFVVQMGLIRISLKFCDGMKGQLDDLLSSFDLLATFISGSVLYFLIILAGLFPGIVWATKLDLFTYFLSSDPSSVSPIYLPVKLGIFMLLIVPGIVWAVQFSLYPYFIVDKRLGPLDAIKASGETTKGIKWDLFLFGSLTGLINLAGLLCLIVGIFATFPVTIVAYAYVYRKLTGGVKAPAKDMYAGPEI